MKTYLLITLITLCLLGVKCQTFGDYDIAESPEFDDLSKLDVSYDSYAPPVRLKNPRQQFYPQFGKRATGTNQFAPSSDEKVSETNVLSSFPTQFQNDVSKQQRVVRESAAAESQHLPPKSDKEAKPAQNPITKHAENKATNSESDKNVDKTNLQPQTKPQTREANQKDGDQKPLSESPPNQKEPAGETADAINKRVEKSAKPSVRDATQTDKKPIERQEIRKKNRRRSNVQQLTVQPRDLLHNGTVPCLEDGTGSHASMVGAVDHSNMDHSNVMDHSNGMDHSNMADHANMIDHSNLIEHSNMHDHSSMADHSNMVDHSSMGDHSNVLDHANTADHSSMVDHPNTMADHSNGMDHSNMVSQMGQGLGQGSPSFEGPSQQTVSQLACVSPSGSSGAESESGGPEGADSAPLRELKLNILRLESRLDAETKQETALARASKEADAVATEIGRKIGVVRLKLRWAADGARADQMRAQELQTRVDALAKALSEARHKLEATEQQAMGGSLRRRRFQDQAAANATDSRRQEQEKAVFDASEDLEHLQVATDAAKSYLDDAMAVVAALSASLGELQAQATAAYQRDAELRMARRRQSDVTHALAAQLGEAQARRMQTLAASLAQAHTKRRRRQLEKRRLYRRARGLSDIELGPLSPVLNVNPAKPGDEKEETPQERVEIIGTSSVLNENAPLDREDAGRQDQAVLESQEDVTKLQEQLRLSEGARVSDGAARLVQREEGDLSGGSQGIEQTGDFELPSNFRVDAGNAGPEVNGRQRDESNENEVSNMHENVERRDKRDDSAFSLDVDLDSMSLPGRGQVHRSRAARYDDGFDQGTPGLGSAGRQYQGDVAGDRNGASSSQFYRDASSANVGGNRLANQAVRFGEDGMSYLGQDRQGPGPKAMAPVSRMPIRDSTQLYRDVSERLRERNGQDDAELTSRTQDGREMNQDMAAVRLVGESQQDQAITGFGEANFPVDMSPAQFANEGTRFSEGRQSAFLGDSPLQREDSREYREDDFDLQELESQYAQLSKEIEAYRPAQRSVSDLDETPRQLSRGRYYGTSEELPQDYQGSEDGVEQIGVTKLPGYNANGPLRYRRSPQSSAESRLQTGELSESAKEMPQNYEDNAASQHEYYGLQKLGDAKLSDFSANGRQRFRKSLQSLAESRQRVRRSSGTSEDGPQNDQEKSAWREEDLSHDLRSPRRSDDAAPLDALPAQKPGAHLWDAAARELRVLRAQTRPRVRRQAVATVVGGASAVQQAPGRPSLALVRSEPEPVPGTGCTGTGSGTGTDREERLTSQLQKVTQQRALEEAHVNHERSEVHRAQLVARGALSRLRAALLRTTQLRTEVCAARAEAEAAARAARCAQAELGRAEAARGRATCAVDALNQKLADTAANDTFECPSKADHRGVGGGGDAACSAEQQFKAIMQKIYLAEANVKVQSVEVAAARRALILQRERLQRVLDTLAAQKAELRAQHKATAAAACASSEAQSLLACHNRRLARERADVAAVATLENDIQRALATLP